MFFFVLLFSVLFVCLHYKNRLVFSSSARCTYWLFFCCCYKFEDEKWVVLFWRNILNGSFHRISILFHLLLWHLNQFRPSVFFHCSKPYSSIQAIHFGQITRCELQHVTHNIPSIKYLHFPYPTKKPCRMNRPTYFWTTANLCLIKQFEIDLTWMNGRWRKKATKQSK